VLFENEISIVKLTPVKEKKGTMLCFRQASSLSPKASTCLISDSKLTLRVSVSVYGCLSQMSLS